ncbi:hypothetical protein RHMOL_Rhmol06G0138500 [Rhododendron molle]|uniref:Uncharacterized protein n=1 Tax=Rhododendron molle TaxID=49168 RepID=A0ACC0ND56_RHOML|nr:hypothetical protein RHMOL_Rhmol06G0138500 [Rhododendron molle]
MSAKASHYERLLVEEQDRKTASKGTYYCDPNFEVVAVEAKADPDVAVAEIINKKPYVCKAFVKMEPTKQPIQNTPNRPTRAYTFDIGRAEAIFDQLLTDKLLKLPFGHKIPTVEELKGKECCKYHNSWSHSTNNCIVFRNDIQDKIERGEFKFPEKDMQPMGVDGNPFPSGLSTNMVSVNMSGMPRTALRQKISLGAHSREVHKYSPDRYWDPYYDERDVRTEWVRRFERQNSWWSRPTGVKKPERPTCSMVCTECGHHANPSKSTLKSIIVGRTEPRTEEPPRSKGRRVQ